MKDKSNVRYGGLLHLSFMYPYFPEIKVLIKSPCQSAPIYQNDVVTLDKDKTIISGGNPGISKYLGVAQDYGAASTKTLHHVLIADESMHFLIPDIRSEIESPVKGEFANFDFQPGNDGSGLSGHCLDRSTQTDDASLDVKLVQIPDPEIVLGDTFGKHRVIVKFNRLPVKSRAGRPKNKGSVSGHNNNQALEFIIRKGKAILTESGKSGVTRHRVARACSGSYGILANGDDCIDKCAGCQQIIRIIKQCNPLWTWNDIRDRINSL
jgi:hypothetical protein